RIFWRGSFLFTPSTENVGAGFKAFRPIVTDEAGLRILANDEIGALGGVYPHSMQQYQLSKDGFYSRMASIINPRALSPTDVLEGLVASLHETMQRRKVSIQKSIEFT